VRLVLVTGKGGVGKTTLAAATAVSAAKRGARTLVVSTDAAHSLGDVLAAPLSGDPVTVSPGLDALHLDGRRELERSWLAISDYLRRLIGWADIDRLHVDELMVVPGLDQLLALARLRSLAEQGRWDAIIVDCAPSADSLRLLTLPDVLRWYVDRVFGSNGVIGGWARRRVQRGLSIPMPGDEVFDSVADLTDQLQRLQELLTQAVTTARIVVTPERVVVAEAQRTLAYLALYGYAVDAVLVNRLLGPELAIPELQQWRNAQDAQILAIDQAFAPLPRLTAEYRQFEPIGIHALSELGREVYDDVDPLGQLAAQPALQITTTARESMVRMPVHSSDRDDIQLHRVEDDLVVTLGTYRRSIRLPDQLRMQEVVRAGLADGHLEVVFAGASNVG
jgi:arsenite-transporting ATPase